MGNAGPKIGQYATRGNDRGIVIGHSSLRAMHAGRMVNVPTVDISTPDGLLVDIPVRHLN